MCKGLVNNFSGELPAVNTVHLHMAHLLVACIGRVLEVLWMNLALSLQLLVAVTVTHVDPGHGTETWDTCISKLPGFVQTVQDRKDEGIEMPVGYFLSEKKR